MVDDAKITCWAPTIGCGWRVVIATPVGKSVLLTDPYTGASQRLPAETVNGLKQGAVRHGWSQGPIGTIEPKSIDPQPMMVWPEETRDPLHGSNPDGSTPVGFRATTIHSTSTTLGSRNSRPA